MYFICLCISLLCQEHFTRVVQEKRELKDYADRVTRELRRQSSASVFCIGKIEYPIQSTFGTSQRQMDQSKLAPQEDERQLSLHDGGLKTTFLLRCHVFRRF